MNSTTTNASCQREEVAAYLDGELSGDPLKAFEAHLKSCVSCATELATQRELLCTLDVAFGKPESFELPQDFPRVVAAYAESDMSGLRKRSERRRALQLCAVLMLVSFALLGATARALILQPTRSYLRIAGSVIDLLWRTIYAAGTGLTVIGRVVGRAVVFGPRGLGLYLALPFVIASALLPLLIVRYHRTQIIE